MPAEVFLDTNVFVHAFDDLEPLKRERARNLIRGERWLASWQVVQEFSNVALHRFAVPLLPEDLSEYLELVLWPRCTVFPSPAVHRKALELHGNLQYRFYDCLMVAAAIVGGAKILYSEDLQHRRTIGLLHIENPFADI